MVLVMETRPAIMMVMESGRRDEMWVGKEMRLELDGGLRWG